MKPGEDSVDSLFLAAVELPAGEERSAYLDNACGADLELRKRVERLLIAQEKVGSFLEAPAPEIGPTLDLPVAERPGTEIGPYKLLQQIGEGGMGVVYMAEQTEPVNRRVALKIIKPGMDSKQVMARFEAERQALALMDHPNIAKVLDAATTESGRPYFVMELVKGVPITTFCDQQHLSPNERLALFIYVCQAVQHAHQKGIIHRDLKPSNVLVALYDGQPVPKVIDFGVAKATSQRLTEKTMFTQLGQVVGTLEYMSPEQAQLNQLDIDTRSDVYSLGVLLYELLTGATPFDRARLRSAAFDEMMRIIREEEPPRPSVRLSTVDTLASVAADRHTEPHKLRALVRGELDWIVMKALEKDRARRYETANGFATDIQRYLNDEPVVACPPSAGYRLRKFTRRNKAMLVTAGILSATLLLGLVGTTSQWFRAKAAADVARHQRDENRRFLYKSDMVAAQQAWANANLRRVIELLDRYKDPEQEDLRGFVWHYLTRLCQRGLETPSLERHKGFVWSVTFSPDGRTLATASDDATVNLWDLETLQIRHTLTGYGGTVLSAAFSSDGKTLATGDAEGMVKLWDPDTGQLRRTIESVGPVVGVAISSNHKLLAGTLGGTLTLCDLAAGEPEIIYGELGGPSVWSVAVSSDGNRLAFGSADGAVRLRDASGDEEWKVLRGHTSWARSTTFSPDGKYLASASHDHTVRVWDAETGESKHVFTHRDRAWSVAFSPDGKTLASTGNTVRLWDIETGKQWDSLIGHEQMVYTVAFSPDGRTLATGSHDTKVKLWDVSRQVTRDTLKAHTGTVMDVAVSNSGTTLASSSEDGSVKLWELATGNEQKTFEEAHSNWVTSIVFSPDDKTLATSGDDGTIKLWDVDKGQKLAVHLNGHTDPSPQSVWQLAFSPDGSTLASAGNDTTIRLWDVRTGKEKGRFTGHTHIAWAVAFSPDGEILASGSDDNTVKLWDLQSGLERTTLRGHTSVVFGVVFSPDGKKLASASGDGDVKLWDLEDGDLLQTFSGHTGLVWCVAFSPDGSMLASGSHDATIMLWDLVAERGPETLIGHASAVQSVMFSPDGTTLASGGGDRTVRLWRRELQSQVRLAVHP